MLLAFLLIPRGERVYGSLRLGDSRPQVENALGIPEEWKHSDPTAWSATWPSRAPDESKVSVEGSDALGLTRINVHHRKGTNCARMRALISERYGEPTRIHARDPEELGQHSDMSLYHWDSKGVDRVLACIDSGDINNANRGAYSFSIARARKGGE